MASAGEEGAGGPPILGGNIPHGSVPGGGGGGNGGGAGGGGRIKLTLPADGACGSADGQMVLAAPTGTAACSAGSLINASGVGSFTWDCQGVGGSMVNASCSATQGAGVTPAPVTNGSVSPPGDQILSPGSRATFAVTADPGYVIDQANSTCPAGSFTAGGSDMVSGTYQTGPLVASDSSCTVTFTFKLAPPLPGAPQNPVAAVGSGQSTVSWDEPLAGTGGPVTLYRVEVVGEPTKFCEVTPPTRRCTVPGLTNGTAYTFEVTARNAGGVSPAATTAPVTPAAPLAIPTLSEWGMILLASLMAMFGLRSARRRG